MPIRRLVHATAARLDQRTSRVLVIAATSYLARFGSALALLITIPLARHRLDAELFGIWMMLSTLLGFFSFADLGVGNGVLNRITSARASGEPDGVVRVIAGGYLCTAAVGAILAILWAGWRLVASDPASFAGALSARNHAEVVNALQTFVLLLALNLPAALIQKVQFGSQQGQWVGITQFVASVATLVAVPATLWLGGTLSMLLFASLGTQVLANLGNTLWWLHRNHLLKALARVDVHRETLHALLRTGGLFFALQLSAAFAFQSDSIVITHVLGAPAYGDFAVVQRLFLLVSAVLSAGLTGLWPAFGDAMARGDSFWARRALTHALLIAGGVAATASLALLVSIDWLTHHWLHAAVSPPLLLTVALATWTIFDAMSGVAGAFMNGANVLRAQLLFALSMGSLAFAGKWWATARFGPAGSVLATLFAYCLISIPGQIFIFNRVFEKQRTTP